jgi:hypothetical protein
MNLTLSSNSKEKSIDRVPQEFRELVKYCKTTKPDIYIFGADIAGKVTQHILKINDIPINAFLDNNKNKCAESIDGINVLQASKNLEKIDKSAVVLIASTYIIDIINQIESQGFYNWVPISNIIESNMQLNFREIIEGDLQHNHSGGEFTKDFVDFAVTNMINSQKKYLDSDVVFIRSVDLIVTERCSLKCKDCSNLMQYYENPINIEGDELIQDLDDICSLADEINEIRIIGGEPLMNKNFHEISLKAASYDNVNKVVIYTNGTICPPEKKIAQLKNDKIFVFITTYGVHSKNERKLAELLEKHDIQYNNQPAYGWTECGGIEIWNRTAKENKEIFKNCCAKHFTTMTDGKLFRCPFSANVERLEAIPIAPSDYISIRGYAKNPKNFPDLKQKVRWFLRDKALIAACDFCSGRTYGDPEIEPGIQTIKPIKYIRHDR